MNQIQTEIFMTYVGDIEVFFRYIHRVDLSHFICVFCINAHLKQKK